MRNTPVYVPFRLRGTHRDEAAPSAASGTSGHGVAQLEAIVSYVLRFGVLLSLAITLLGTVLLFTLDPSQAVVRRTGPPVPHDLAGLLAGLLQLQPEAIIDAGLLLLIATPVLRVAVSVVAFLRDKDYVYTAITLFVLAVLLASFFLGRVE